MSEITCDTLRFSWFLIAVGLTPMFLWGHIGFVFGLPPLIWAQNIRAPHDKANIGKIMQMRLPMILAAIYWLTLMCIAIAVRANGMKLSEIPIGLAAVLFSLPLFAGALYGDLRFCSGRK